jgi:putative membrane protein insertion efficiency factor
LLQAALAFVFLLPLRAYRRLISPLLPARCKYYPSCSAYAEQAVRELGVVRGTVLATWRLVRCNPWSHGGVDELADRTLFKDAELRSERLARAAGDHHHGAPA